MGTSRKENSQVTHITAAEHKAKVIVQSAEQKRDEIDRQTEQKQTADEYEKTVREVAEIKAVLPAIQTYFETEEGQREFAAWQAERQQKQLNNKLNFAH